MRFGLRLLRAKKLENVSPPLPRRNHTQEFSEPAALRAVENQKIHARGMIGVLRALQQPGINEAIDGLGDFLHVIPDKRGELLNSQERARMPMQEHQHIELTGVADGDPSEQALRLFEVWMMRKRLISHDDTIT